MPSASRNISGPGTGHSPDVRTCSSCSRPWCDTLARDRKSTGLNSSHGYISYAVFCLKKKKIAIDRVRKRADLGGPRPDGNKEDGWKSIELVATCRRSTLTPLARLERSVSEVLDDTSE